jgi:hypothetical protein
MPPHKMVAVAANVAASPRRLSLPASATRQGDAATEDLSEQLRSVHVVDGGSSVLFQIELHEAKATKLICDANRFIRIIINIRSHIIINHLLI